MNLPANNHYLEQIEKELAMARAALQAGNEGKARVCARRAAGQAITWMLSKFSRDNWGDDAMSQLTHLRDDASFPTEVREAAVRLTTKISQQFDYPFTNDPLADAEVIIKHIRTLMERNDD
jgi:hypothetical protein